MSVTTQTVLGNVTTRVGPVDLSQGIATLYINPTTILKIIQTNYITQPITSIISRKIATALNVTYTLSFGNFNTAIITQIPTNIILFHSTMLFQTQPATPPTPSLTTVATEEGKKTTRQASVPV